MMLVIIIVIIAIIITTAMIILMTSLRQLRPLAMRSLKERAGALWAGRWMDNMGVGWVGVGCPRIWLGMVALRVHIYGAGPGDNHCYRLKTHLVLGLIHQHQKAPSSASIWCRNWLLKLPSTSVLSCFDRFQAITDHVDHWSAVVDSINLIP